jgi:hypothetical protein
MPETKNEEGAEATFAPGEDLSFQSTELLLEEMASTMMDAEIKETYLVHYTAVNQTGPEAHTIELKTLKACHDNAASLTKSPSIIPNTVRITSQKVIILPTVEHSLIKEEPQDAPIWKTPEAHPYIPTN